MRAGKWFTLFISNGNMYNIIKFIKLLEDLVVLLNGVTEKIKCKMKIKEGGFFWALFVPLASYLVQTVISLVVKGISGKELKEEEDDIWVTIFSSTPSFKQYRDY